MNKETIVLDAYTEEIVLALLKWIRNDNIANNMFNYNQIKGNGKAVTEKELLDLFVSNNHTHTKSYPIGYSILKNAEN